MPNLLTHLNIGDQKTTINSIHYIAGTGSTAGTWLGADSSINEYYDGLTIAYKIPIKGATTTTLNITGSAGTALGAKTVYRNGSSKITTHYGVGSVVLLVYTTNSSNVGSWQCVDYDSNTTYTFNGAVSTIKDRNLTASRALISNSSGKVAVSSVTSTQLGYLTGVTSSIQTQLNGKLTQATADARYALKSEIGGGGTTSVQILTRAEYSALTTISSDVLYIVRG